MTAAGSSAEHASSSQGTTSSSQQATPAATPEPPPEPESPDQAISDIDARIDRIEVLLERAPATLSRIYGICSILFGVALVVIPVQSWTSGLVDFQTTNGLFAATVVTGAIGLILFIIGTNTLWQSYRFKKLLKEEIEGAYAVTEMIRKLVRTTRWDSDSVPGVEHAVETLSQVMDEANVTMELFGGKSVNIRSNRTRSGQ